MPDYKFRVNGGKQWKVGEVSIAEAEAYDFIKTKRERKSRGNMVSLAKLKKGNQK